MDIQDDYISSDLYTNFLERMPQVCVDIFLEKKGKVLLAKRNNEPARGEWFWSRGRLFKGEELNEAVHRIGKEELGISVNIVRRLGVYNHFWETSPFEDVDSVHTVNIVYRVRSKENIENIILDDQHEDYKFVSEIDCDFHVYVKKYLKDSGIFD